MDKDDMWGGYIGGKKGSVSHRSSSSFLQSPYSYVFLLDFPLVYRLLIP